MDHQNVQELSEVLSAKTKVLANPESWKKDENRKDALFAAKALVSALEKPEENIFWWSNTAIVVKPALKLGVDLRIFHILCDAKEPVTSQMLAQQTGAEEFLLTRLMRFLCSMNFAKQAGIQSYSPNPHTKALTNPGLEAGVIIIDEFEAVTALPGYLKQNRYKSPTNSKDCAFQWANKSPMGYFEKVNEAGRSKVFSDFMGIIRSTRRVWTDWYDLEGRLLQGYEDGTFMIDVGGAEGHNLIAVGEKFPMVRGSLILQDLPTVIEGITAGSPDWIKPMSYDFFTKQPVTGARVYYMHFCLHDWADDECRSILLRMKEAMKPGYSKLVLNESVLPDVGCDPYFAAQDLSIMAIMAGITRSRSQWRSLLESVGLTIVEIFESPFDGDNEGVIEAILE